MLGKKFSGSFKAIIFKKYYALEKYWFHNEIFQEIASEKQNNSTQQYGQNYQQVRGTTKHR